MDRMILDMPAAEYHAHPAISKSGLDDVAQSPMHYKYRRENPEDMTDALNFGHAFHTLLLEPASFGKRVAVWSGAPRNTKAGKDEWEKVNADNTGKTIIKQKEYEQMQGMARAILAHPAAAHILSGKGRVEPSLFWTDEETGVECRCRPDWLRDDGLIVDLKTTVNAKASRFEKSAYDYRYHVQTAFYYEGVMRVTGKQPAGFVFVACEKEPPYGVSVLNADAEVMALGELDYKHDLAVYAECLESGRWPGYPETIENLMLPAWAAKRLNEGVGIYV